MNYGCTVPPAPKPLDPDWREKAKCLGLDTEMFFSQVPYKRRRAIRVCADCPVRTDCSDFAASWPQTQGVWAGRDFSTYYRKSMEAESR